MPDCNRDAYKSWMENHQHVCTKNKSFSSIAIEAQGAEEVWNRSLTKHNIRYSAFAEDGGSKACNNVVKTEQYVPEVEIK